MITFKQFIVEESNKRIRAKDIGDICHDAWLKHGASEDVAFKRVSKFLRRDLPELFYYQLHMDKYYKNSQNNWYLADDLWALYKDFKRHGLISKDGDHLAGNSGASDYPLSCQKVWDKIWQVSGLNKSVRRYEGN